MADVGLPRPRGVAYHVVTPPGCAAPRLRRFLNPNPPKRCALALTQRMMGKGRRTGLA